MQTFFILEKSHSSAAIVIRLSEVELFTTFFLSIVQILNLYIFDDLLEVVLLCFHENFVIIDKKFIHNE